MLVLNVGCHKHVRACLLNHLFNGYKRQHTPPPCDMGQPRGVFLATHAKDARKLREMDRNGGYQFGALHPREQFHDGVVSVLLRSAFLPLFKDTRLVEDDCAVVWSPASFPIVSEVASWLG